MSVKNLIASFSKIKHWRYAIAGCLCFVLTAAVAQTEQNKFTSANTVQKVALVDHSRLRKQYNGLKLAKDSARKEWQALQQQYQLKQGDNLKNGKNNALSVEFSKQQKQLMQQRDARFQQYESKIRAAINKVVAEGGFTDVQPLAKDKSRQGIDITDEVLKKLN